MKTRQLVHITCEIIIITVVSMYFHKRIKKVSEDVEALKKENAELRTDLEDTRRVLASLSSFILQQSPSSATLSPSPIPIPQMPNIQKKFIPRPRERVVFHPLPPIQEEECDEDKCRSGLSELEEEGSMLSKEEKEMTSPELPIKEIRDTVSVIAFNVPVPVPIQKKEGSAHIELINEPISSSSSSNSSSESISVQISDNESKSDSIIKQDNEKKSPVEAVEAVGDSENGRCDVIDENTSTTKNENLKVIDPSVLNQIRKRPSKKSNP
jgi:hypothetical protein